MSATSHPSIHLQQRRRGLNKSHRECEVCHIEQLVWRKHERRGTNGDEAFLPRGPWNMAAPTVTTRTRRNLPSRITSAGKFEREQDRSIKPEVNTLALAEHGLDSQDEEMNSVKSFATRSPMPWNMVESPDNKTLKDLSTSYVLIRRTLSPSLAFLDQHSSSRKPPKKRLMGETGAPYSILQRTRVAEVLSSNVLESRRSESPHRRTPSHPNSDHHRNAREETRGQVVQPEIPDCTPRRRGEHPR